MRRDSLNLAVSRLGAATSGKPSRENLFRNWLRSADAAFGKPVCGGEFGLASPRRPVRRSTAFRVSACLRKRTRASRHFLSRLWRLNRIADATGLMRDGEAAYPIDLLLFAGAAFGFTRLLAAARSADTLLQTGE